MWEPLQASLLLSQTGLASQTPGLGSSSPGADTCSQPESGCRRGSPDLVTSRPGLPDLLRLALGSASTLWKLSLLSPLHTCAWVRSGGSDPAQRGRPVGLSQGMSSQRSERLVSSGAARENPQTNKQTKPPKPKPKNTHNNNNKNITSNHTSIPEENKFRHTLCDQKWVLRA